MPAALPGVSYIVTTYNKAPYLESVLRALATQEGDFERQFILVDDGSSDGSAELAARLLRDLPRADLITQENRGPSAAVNRGLALAALPFTQIVDGDDILAPYASKLLLQAAVSSGCAAVYGRNGYYAADGPRFPPEPRSPEVTVLADPLYAVIRIGHAGGSTYICETAALKRMGGADERVFIQDQSIAQRLARAGPMGLVDCLVAMGPRDDPGRLMKNPAQLLHDQSLTAILTLADCPELPLRFRRLVQRQVTGRAWKFAARSAGASYGSRYFRLFLRARLPFVQLTDAMLLLTLDAFRTNARIRVMPGAESAAEPSGAAARALRSGPRNDPIARDHRVRSSHSRSME